MSSVVHAGARAATAARLGFVDPSPTIARSDDAQSRAPLRRRWPRTLALSFLATVVGWLVATAVLLTIFLLQGDRPSNWDDSIAAVAGLVGLHCAAAWALAVAPLALTLAENSQVYDLRSAPIFGACWGALLMLFALLLWGLPLSPDAWVFLAPAAVCGAVTWTLFAALQRAAARSDELRAQNRKLRGA